MSEANNPYLVEFVDGDLSVIIHQVEEAKNGHQWLLAIMEDELPLFMRRFHWESSGHQLDLPTTSRAGVVAWVLNQMELGEQWPYANRIRLALLNQKVSLGCLVAIHSPELERQFKTEFGLTSLKGLTDFQVLSFHSGESTLVLKGDELIPHYYLGTEESLESILPFDTFWSGLLQVAQLDPDFRARWLDKRNLNRKHLKAYWSHPIVMLLVAARNGEEYGDNPKLTPDEQELFRYLVQGIPLELYFGYGEWTI